MFVFSLRKQNPQQLSAHESIVSWEMSVIGYYIFGDLAHIVNFRDAKASPNILHIGRKKASPPVSNGKNICIEITLFNLNRR